MIICIFHQRQPPNSLIVLVPSENKSFQQVSESGFSGVWVVDRCQEAVPGRRTGSFFKSFYVFVYVWCIVIFPYVMLSIGVINEQQQQQ